MDISVICMIRSLFLAVVMTGLALFPAGIGGHVYKTELCPTCRSKNWIPAFYGFPEPDAAEMVEKGELYWLGCVPESQGKVSHYCRDCETLW